MSSRGGCCKSVRTIVGFRRARAGGAAVIGTLLLQLEADKPVLTHLRGHIEAQLPQLPGGLLTLPGVSRLSAVSLFAETDPISTLASADQLAAYAGLDSTVFQTGTYDAPHRSISKRGSPHLRRTLGLMSMAAILQPGTMRDHYQERLSRGLHHDSALTAVALKLCRIAWRVLTDARDYLPVPPGRKAVAPASNNEAST